MLSGRTILDCSTLLPGPFVGKLLLTRGARVVKVENPDRPDGAREMGSGSAYRDLNEGKELVWLNLTLEPDRARFRELVAGADGLIEGFRPAAKAKLGLTEAELLGINPRLCIASLVGYPEDGPWRDRAGHDLNFQAVSGALALSREIPGFPLADLFTSYGAALALVAAMDAVSRGAPGRRLTLSMTDALHEAQSLWFREYRESGREPHPGDTLMTGKYPCYNLYATADGRRVAVGAIEAKFWERVCEILGLPELREKGYATGQDGEETRRRLQAAIGAKPWAHWAPLFDAADCCVELVLNYSEVRI